MRDLRARRADPRSDRVLALGLLISLLLHAALFAVLAALPRAARPQPQEAQEAEDPPLVVRFVETLPAEPPAEPPDTEFISERDAVAESPEPLPEEPDPAPRAERRPRREPAPAPPAPPDERQPDEEPQDDDPAEKRARLDALLRGLRDPDRSWADVAADAPELSHGAVGGDSLQFESKADVDWGPYAARIKRIVRSNWRIPMAAQAGINGITQVHFFIRRDGGIEDLEVTRESGAVPLDVSARDAIALSDALPPPPLPANLDEDRVGVTWSFLYNIDEREWRRWLRDQRFAERAARRP